MSIMLEKWPGKAQVYLKYMHVIRLAASRVSNLGWVSYDEQFRLRKARAPQSSWADVDVELWLLYVSAPDSPFLMEWNKNEHRDFSSDMSKKGIRTCWGYTKRALYLWEKLQVHSQMLRVVRKPSNLGL